MLGVAQVDVEGREGGEERRLGEDGGKSATRECSFAYCAVLVDDESIIYWHITLPGSFESGIAETLSVRLPLEGLWDWTAIVTCSCSRADPCIRRIEAIQRSTSYQHHLQ